MKHNVIDVDDILEKRGYLEEIRSQHPAEYKAMLKEKNNELRILPRALRRSYRSKNAKLIQGEIRKALEQGFTFHQIQDDFEDWKSRMEFID